VTRFRLIADDLTGALDSAARFVPRFGPIPVLWRDPSDLPAVAFDTATREAPAARVDLLMAHWTAHLAGPGLAFKKLDSLLRGHPAAEIAACLRAGGFAHAVIAPAFPFQARITQGGRQLAHGQDVGVDLALEFARLGVMLSHCRPGDAPSPGVSLWDAARDADLDLVVAAGRSLPGPVLWCGTAGLAAALGGRVSLSAPALPRPVLALIGSDHPASRAQLAAVPARATLPDASSIAGRSVAVDVALPPVPRAEAARRIAAAFAGLATAIPRPGSLVVAGGETLRGLCTAIGTEHLMVESEIEPGLPVSRMVGGLWDGLTVASKSGAFGAPDLLARLLS
jgi:uncharacterized protein YgbK (DUF1537 family)